MSDLTFEQFQGTRRFVDDIGEVIPDARWTDYGPEHTSTSGYVYLDDALYIEEVDSHWPTAARKQGRWYLLLGRDEWISDDLTALERRLYSWACDEGYCAGGA